MNEIEKLRFIAIYGTGYSVRAGAEDEHGIIARALLEQKLRIDKLIEDLGGETK